MPARRNLHFEIATPRNGREDTDGWLVEAIDFDGEGIIFSTLFTGHLAEERAKEYAAWKNGQGSTIEDAFCVLPASEPPHPEAN